MNLKLKAARDPPVCEKWKGNSNGWPVEHHPSFPVLVMLGLFSKFNGDFRLFKEIRTSCLALCRSPSSMAKMTRTPPKSPAVSIKDSRGQTYLAHTWPEVLPVCFSAGTNFSVAIGRDFCAAPARQLCAGEQMHRKLRGPSTNLCAAFQLRCTRFKWVKVQNSYPRVPEHLTEPSTEFRRF